MVSLIELKNIADIIKNEVGSARIDNVYKYKNKFIFKTRNKMILISLPDYITMTNKFKVPFEVTNLTSFIRKRIKNKKIEDIRIVNWDRIICFEFDEYKIYLELFSKGNFIICDNENIILVASKYETRKDRTIRKHETYSPPKNSKPVDLSDIDAVKNALGQDITETKLKKLGVNPKRINMAEDVAKQITELWNNGDENITITINNLAEEFITETNTHEKSPKIKKLETMVEKQKQTITEYSNRVIEIDKEIEVITNNYDEIEKLLNDQDNQLEKRGYKIEKKYPKIIVNKI